MTTTIEAVENYNNLRSIALAARDDATKAAAVAEGSHYVAHVPARVLNRVRARTVERLVALEQEILAALAADGAPIPRMPSECPPKGAFGCESMTVLDRAVAPTRWMYPDYTDWRTPMLLGFVAQCAESAWADIAAELENEARAAEAEFETLRLEMAGEGPQREVALTNGDAVHHVVTCGDQRLEWLEVRGHTLAETMLTRLLGSNGYSHARATVERAEDGSVRLQLHLVSGAASTLTALCCDFEAVISQIRDAYRKRDARLAIEPTEVTTEI
jgi:hypothetical protein